MGDGQEVLGSGVDGGGMGGVKGNRVETGVLGGDAVHKFGAAAADDHGVVVGLQCDREGQADAAGGAWDEDGVAGDVHCFSLGEATQLWQAPVIGGSAVPG